jgi:hypothetical protein
MSAAMITRLLVTMHVFVFPFVQTGLFLGDSSVDVVTGP